MISIEARSLPRYHPLEVEVLLPLPPAVRGFWFDDEMLNATGLTSVPLLRKVQGLGLLESSHVAMSVGGRRRVWTFPDVLLGQLLFRFSELARMPVQAAAEWLVQLPRDWLLKAIDLKQLVDEAMGEPFDPPELVGTTFIIIDMQDVWFEQTPDYFMQAGKPEAAAISQDMEIQSMAELLENVGTALLVDVGAINLTVCDRVRDERLAYNAARERARS